MLIRSPPARELRPGLTARAGTDALIYVVDSSDVDRVDLAAEELRAVLDTDEMARCAVLVYANKQDLPRAMGTADLAARLGLHDLRGHKWRIQASSAVTGDGLYEGLDWVVENLPAEGKA